jgi:hypothetical protein
MAPELEIARDSIDYARIGLSPVRGVPLKFDNGSWYRGFEREPAPDQDYLANDFSETWRCVKNGCPVEYVPRKPESPTRPPRPSTFAEKSSWPLYNGEPSDPWTYCSVVHLLALSNGETFNFASPTAGAWVCRNELLEQIKSMRQMMQTQCLPIVRLASTTFKTKFGTRQRPMLRITGWQRSKMETNKLNQIAPAQTVNPFNDELPKGL